MKNLFKKIKNFIIDKNNRFLLFSSIVAIEVLVLYIIGMKVHKEIGRRYNYPLALAEILTVLVYGLFYKASRPLLEKKVPKISRFLSQKSSAPYIAAFMALLIVAVIFSITKYSFFVIQISNVVYFMLLTAVAFEFFEVIKEK